MLRYFYAPGTCSLAGMAALELSGADFEAIAVDLAGDRAQLRAVNPSGKVPVLVTEARTVTDTVAILYYLARRFPEAGLLPLSDDEMTTALSTMAWLGSSLHILRRQFARPMMFVDDAGAEALLRAAARPRYWQGLQEVDAWCAGEQLPLGVEIYALVFYNWGMIDGLPVGELASFSKMVTRLLAWPDVVRALDSHRSPLTAAQAT